MVGSGAAVRWLPVSDAGWCAHFRMLDAKYGTDVRSPLHHDSRCPVHGPGVGK